MKPPKGSWHWDDARASLDACIACLPDTPFRGELEIADSRRSDCMVVWRWGCALGRALGLDEPWRYANALTNSTAVGRPSLETRERKEAGEPMDWPSDEWRDRWEDIRMKAGGGGDEW